MGFHAKEFRENRHPAFARGLHERRLKMKRYSLQLILLGLIILFSLTASQVFSQQEALRQEELDSPVQENHEWILGDVVSLDLESNQLILSFIDDHTNQGKEIAISVDPATDYTNVDSVKDIKVDDVVAIDYKISPEGEALALSISVEH